jgi:hypothetical protein
MKTVPALSITKYRKLDNTQHIIDISSIKLGLKFYGIQRNGREDKEETLALNLRECTTPRVLFGYWYESASRGGDTIG